jgi:hypothetical protein
MAALGLPALVIPVKDAGRPAVGDHEEDVRALRGGLEHREHAPRPAPDRVW